jgi:uncharacterized protein DUF4956
MKKIVDNVLVRLAAYYLAVLAIYEAFRRAFPDVLDAVGRERVRGIAGSLFESPDRSPDLAPIVPATEGEALGVIVLTLVGALVVSLPVALVYQWTSEPDTYRRDFGRSLLVLPIAVALAVFLVKNNLALAFSLTGIVAVVRWRTTLEYAMDGVFMFIMIGIGLAAGVQLLVVALVASILFNAVILVLSRAKYATRPRQLEGWTLSPAVPEQSIPKADRTVGVRVDAPSQAKAEARLETIFPLCAKEWEQAAAEPLDTGGVRLKYRVKLKKRTTPDSLVSTIANLGVPEIGGVSLIGEN